MKNWILKQMMTTHINVHIDKPSIPTEPALLKLKVSFPRFPFFNTNVVVVALLGTVVA